MMHYFVNTRGRIWHSEDFLLNWLAHVDSIFVLYFLTEHFRKMVTAIFYPLMCAYFNFKVPPFLHDGKKKTKKI